MRLENSIERSDFENIFGNFSLYVYVVNCNAQQITYEARTYIDTKERILFIGARTNERTNERIADIARMQREMRVYIEIVRVIDMSEELHTWQVVLTDLA